MRPRPQIHSFPLASAAALLLTLGALVFSLCYENPNYAQSADFHTTYWWAGAFGLVALLECAIDFFIPKANKNRDVYGFFTSAAEFFLILYVIQVYFSTYSDTEGAYRAPRYAAAIVLALIVLLSAASKILDFTHPDFFKNPIHNELAVVVLAGLGQLLFASFVWSDSATHGALYEADGIVMIIALILGLASFLYAIYLFGKKDLPDEEILLRNSLYGIGAGALAALICLFIAIGLWNQDAIAYQVYYWDVFSMIGYLLSCCGGGGYLFYVYYRLRN